MDDIAASRRLSKIATVGRGVSLFSSDSITSPPRPLEMPPACRSAVPIPSATLLSFLRVQAESSSFFTANGAASCAIKKSVWRHPQLSALRARLRQPVELSKSVCSLSSLLSLDSTLQRTHGQPLVCLQASILPFLSGASKKTTAESSNNSSQLRGYRRDYPQHQKTWWHWLQWWRSRRDPQQTQEAGQHRRNALRLARDLYPFGSFLDDSTGLGRIPRGANELKLRCTEVDKNGKSVMVDREFRKVDLSAKYGLLPRDLRKIDSSVLPTILVRPHAVLLNLLALRVLIQHNRVLVFDAYGSTDTFLQSKFMYDLEDKLRQRVDGSPLQSREKQLSEGGAVLPYEFRALEAVLLAITAGLEKEFENVREPVVRILRELEEDIDREKLRMLLIYSKKLGTFEQKARLVRDALYELLEADDDLAAMYLTEKAEGTARQENDHTEIEMLLESYSKVCDEIVQVSGNLVSNIKNTEEIIRAILDANRNQLMQLDLKFSVLTLGIGAGTFVAALYGMNLKNFIEESDLGFWGVSAWCSVFSVVVCVYGLRKLHRVQRLRMWGGPGSTPSFDERQAKRLQRDMELRLRRDFEALKAGPDSGSAMRRGDLQPEELGGTVRNPKADDTYARLGRPTEN